MSGSLDEAQRRLGHLADVHVEEQGYVPAWIRDTIAVLREETDD